MASTKSDSWNPDTGHWKVAIRRKVAALVATPDVLPTEDVSVGTGGSAHSKHNTSHQEPSHGSQLGSTTTATAGGAGAAQRGCRAVPYRR